LILYCEKRRRPTFIHRTLTRVIDHWAQHVMGLRMQRLRLKADGRIVELRDGGEFPLAPVNAVDVESSLPIPAPAVRDLRRRAQLTQMEFAARLGVPVETIRNWEQGKRLPRGPARALLAVIAHAPDAVFAALERRAS
jgi:putative transcriptional regulator